MRIRAILTFAVVVVSGSSSPAWAQQESGQVEQSLRPPLAPPPLEPEVPQINIENRPELKSSGATIKVRVRQFVITGSKSFDAESLRSIVKEGEGRELTLDQIKAWADQITIYYRSKGYGAAWAYVPVQTLKDGIVEIAVVEAKVGKLLVGGNKVYSSSFILSHLSPVQDDETLSLDELERGLFTLNEYPGLRVRAMLRPGEGPGLTDVYVHAQDEGPFLVSFDFDNFGSESVGKYRLGASVDWLNVADLGHLASLRAVYGLGSGDLTFLKLGYSIPLPPGPRITLNGAIYDFEAGDQLALLDPTGDGVTFGIQVAYPLISNRTYKLIPEVGFDYKNLKQDLLGATVSEDKLRVLVLGVSFEWNDMLSGRWTGNVQYRKGMPGYLGGLEDVDPDASRFGAGGEFDRTSLLLFRLQKVASFLYLIGKLNYQQSSDVLVVSEQLALGGADSLRGYSPFELMGDKGYVATVEARLRLTPFLDDTAAPGTSFWDNLQIALFYDWGQIELNSTLLGAAPKEDRAAAGIGFRLEIPQWGSIRFDVAWPQSDEDPSNGDNVFYYINVISRVN